MWTSVGLPSGLFTFSPKHERGTAVLLAAGVCVGGVPPPDPPARWTLVTRPRGRQDHKGWWCEPRGLNPMRGWEEGSWAINPDLETLSNVIRKEWLFNLISWQRPQLVKYRLSFLLHIKNNNNNDIQVGLCCPACNSNVVRPSDRWDSDV